jgi:hypothetical protein
MGVPLCRIAGTVRSRVDVDCGTGIAGGWSSSRTGDKGDADIGGGSEKDSRCMLSSGRGTGAVCGEREEECVVMLTERGDPGGVKSRPFTAVAGCCCLAGLASERLRFFNCHFGRPAGLRSPELLDRTSDTVASFIRRSDANGLRGDTRDPDGDGCGDRNGVDDNDSSSSMSTAFSSIIISRSSGGGCPRLVRMFMARLRGETGGEGPSVSLVWAMEGMTREDSLRFVSNKYYGAATNAMNHFESTYLGGPAKAYSASNILKDSERVAVVA